MGIILIEVKSERLSGRRHPSRLPEILTGLAILLVLGLSTVLSQTFKAANANPVDSLRRE